MTRFRLPLPDPAATGSRRVGGYPLAIGLATLAGAVDAVGFLHWGGLFVSFMSGNSTMLGVRTADGAWPEAGLSLAIIAAFVAGVATGELLVAALGRYAQALLLLLVAALLAGAAAASRAGSAELATAPLLGLAMGLQNAVVHRAAGVNVALTYVTGTLVQTGRALANALLRTAPWAAAAPFVGLWCALVGGAVLGALAVRHSATAALAGASAAAAMLAAIVAVLIRSGTRTRRAR